jgi:hypothetical protein
MEFTVILIIEQIYYLRNPTDNATFWRLNRFYLDSFFHTAYTKEL